MRGLKEAEGSGHTTSETRQPPHVFQRQVVRCQESCLHETLSDVDRDDFMCTLHPQARYMRSSGEIRPIKYDLERSVFEGR